MPTAFRLPVTRCALLAALFSLATRGFAADGDENEADHEALRRLRAVVERAVNENRLELLKPYLDENFSIVTYTDREFTDFDAFQTRWQQTRDNLLAGGSYRTELLPERSRILDDFAITRGN